MGVRLRISRGSFPAPCDATPRYRAQRAGAGRGVMMMMMDVLLYHKFGQGKSLDVYLKWMGKVLIPPYCLLIFKRIQKQMTMGVFRPQREREKREDGGN